MADTPVGLISLTKLKRLTVPKLRSLCKENGLTGYSKLTKDAIIFKLAPLYSTNLSSRSVSSLNQEHGCTTGTLSTCRLSGAEADVTTELSTTSSPVDPTNGARNQSRPHTTKSGTSGGDRGVPHPLQTLNSSDGPSPPHGDQAVEDVLKRTNLKRGFPNDIPDKNAGRKSKKSRIITNTSPAQASLADSLFKLPALPSRLLTSETHSAMGPDKQASAGISFVAASQVLCDTIKPDSAKRFKPLFTSENANEQAAFGGEEATLDVARICRYGEPFQDSSCLEFPVEPVVDLKQLTLPPSISKRKRAQQFAIILSGISFTDLLNCSLVSRMFRYSAHLSAYHRLRREFPGQRTETQMKRSNANMTNVWPYLLQRQQELSTRKRIYMESFLSKAVGEWFTLTEHLWTSPDDPKQATVAIRFILTLFYFLVSVHGVDHPEARRKHAIVECKEIIKDEIWIVSVSSLGVQDNFYVLEPTCEVIGCQEKAVCEYAYTDSGISPGGKSLFERVKRTNHEEYDKGIGKHWLKKMNEEAPKSNVRVQIAQRYILACVVANSISGKWMSSVEMAQEFAGLPDNGYRRSKPRKEVQLYIPEHHYVESVHLMSAKKRPLHSALAVVQTPGREYFILRDNGMQVGCEEEGVSAVWMLMLGCCNDGTPA
ncbi:hypothetical protein M378DRAFT_984157 [Amanita muscaria Koide BX008]|uniref:Rho termination factor-like N-terminal domain-containing protein n=1 Tax=Amanita muscaria (strain Koide BX008) TaxID=946122 RepID=A0A0C2TL79_AMAMK|nr:hypothetical protein M378DRAFT_984157 [Amanita muscaria Koide BX008]